MNRQQLIFHKPAQKREAVLMYGTKENNDFGLLAVDSGCDPRLLMGTIRRLKANKRNEADLMQAEEEKRMVFEESMEVA